MSSAIQILSGISSVLFGALAVVAVVQWVRRRDVAAGRLALTFLSLGPDRDRRPAPADPAARLGREDRRAVRHRAARPVPLSPLPVRDCVPAAVGAPVEDRRRVHDRVDDLDVRVAAFPGEGRELELALHRLRRRLRLSLGFAVDRRGLTALARGQRPAVRGGEPDADARLRLGGADTRSDRGGRGQQQRRVGASLRRYSRFSARSASCSA